MSFASLKKNKEPAAQVNVLDLERGGQDVLTASLNQISSSLSEFTSLVSNISKQESALGTKRDTPASRDNVDNLMTDCQRIHSNLLKDLNHLQNVLDDNNNADISDKELMTIKFSKDLLGQQIRDVYKNYQVIVRSYNEKLHSALVQEQYEKTLADIEQEKRRQQAVVNSKNIITDKTPLISNEQSSTHYTANSQLQQQLQTTNNQISDSSLQYHSDLIQQRDQAITSISQGVQDINKIFKDLDQMVNQQGEQVDSIENNMMNYATNNQLASHELIKADNYQKKKRKWTCILLFALVVVLLIVLAIIS